MSLFLALLVIGLVGMVLMAIPGLNRHGHAGIGTHSPVHLPHASHIGNALPKGAHAPGQAPTGNAPLTRFIPAPRVIFGFLALYGAFGNAFEKAGHLSVGLSALLALLPALVLQKYALNPFWNKLMSFQGEPCAPLETLVMTEAKAVTPFRNGRGMVSVLYDGRLVQMRAELPPAQASIPVKVGDVLRVEDIDSRHERVTVSLQ